MSLTKLFQVVQLSTQGEALKVWKTCRTDEECERYLSSNDDSDYMGPLTFTVRPIWTNASSVQIKRMLKE